VHGPVVKRRRIGNVKVLSGLVADLIGLPFDENLEFLYFALYVFFLDDSALAALHCEAFTFPNCMCVCGVLQWLSYWIIFSLFTLVEFFLDIILAWVPLYYEAKLIFILWLALPQTKGALKLWTDHKDKIEQLYSVALTHLEKIQANPAAAKPAVDGKTE